MMQIDYKILKDSMAAIKINGYLSENDINQVLNLFELAKGTLIPTDNEDNYLVDCYIKRTELAQKIDECGEIEDFVTMALYEKELFDLQTEIECLESKYKVAIL